MTENTTEQTEVPATNTESVAAPQTPQNEGVAHTTYNRTLADIFGQLGWIQGLITLFENLMFTNNTPQNTSAAVAPPQMSGEKEPDQQTEKFAVVGAIFAMGREAKFFDTEDKKNKFIKDFLQGAGIKGTVELKNGHWIVNGDFEGTVTKEAYRNGFKNALKEYCSEEKLQKEIGDAKKDKDVSFSVEDVDSYLSTLNAVFPPSQADIDKYFSDICAGKTATVVVNEMMKEMGMDNDFPDQLKSEMMQNFLKGAGISGTVSIENGNLKVDIPNNVSITVRQAQAGVRKMLQGMDMSEDRIDEMMKICGQVSKGVLSFSGIRNVMRQARQSSPIVPDKFYKKFDDTMKKFCGGEENYKVFKAQVARDMANQK